MSDKKWNKWDTAWLGFFLSVFAGTTGGMIANLVTGNLVGVFWFLVSSLFSGIFSISGVLNWFEQRPQYKWADLSPEEQKWVVTTRTDKSTFDELDKFTRQYWVEQAVNHKTLGVQPVPQSYFSTVIPEQDVILTGYRRFRLTLDEQGHVLQGSYGAFWPTQTLVAGCQSGSVKDHLISLRCGCGIYSFRDRQHNDWKSDDGFCVEAEVVNSGMVHIFERGYRSEEATITRLWVHLPPGLPVDPCEALRARYGVPVELVETTENLFDSAFFGGNSPKLPQAVQNYLAQPPSSFCLACANPILSGTTHYCSLRYPLPPGYIRSAQKSLAKPNICTTCGINDATPGLTQCVLCFKYPGEFSGSPQILSGI